MADDCLDGSKLGRKDKSSKLRRAPRLWHKWVGLCRSINSSFKKAFTNLGYIITRRPSLTIVLGVAISLALTGGFARYNLIKRAEDLYLPKNSQASKDLDRVDDTFPMRFKTESFIIHPKDSNAPLLTEAIFKIALEIHHQIIRISGFGDVCIMNEQLNSCAVLSPLEFFDFNNSKIRDVSQKLHQVLNGPNVLSSDGRQAYTKFPYYFSNFKTEQTNQGMEIKRADALKNDYFVKDPSNRDIYNKLERFEDKYVEIMSRKEAELSGKGLILLYNFGRSIDISVSDSAKKDITLVPIALLLMAIFCGIALARFRNRILGHFNLALAGILVLFLAIASAFCFVMLIGAPYIAFAGVLPFLVLGVGIDDMFIIIDAVDRQHPSIKSNTRIAKALGEVCTSITMTTLTDLVAFFVSMVTDFPAIRYFCMYAAFSITFCYILVITVFVALLSFDVKRIEAKQCDVIPCINAKEMTEEVWEEGDQSIINKFITKYAEVLMLKPVKVIIIIVSIAMTAFGIYGAVNVDQSFNQLVLGLKGSAYVKYFSYYETAFPSGIPVHVVLDTPVNYTDASIQKQYRDLSQIAIENKYMESETFNWMRDMLSWVEDKNLTMTGRHFQPALFLFLQAKQHFLVDIKFHADWLVHMLKWTAITNKLVTVDNFYDNLELFLIENPQIGTYIRYNNTTHSMRVKTNTKEDFEICDDGECSLIKACRFMITTKSKHFSTYRRDAMLSLREDLRTKSELPVYGISYNYIYVEQFVVILSDTIRNLAICACAILLITLPYLVDPKVTFFVFAGFVCLMFELFGVMYLWGVSLNAISMIIIVMGIGFSVDYSAHIAHAFVVCNEKTSERRVIYAMRTMGASVTMGGISTFVGVLATAFAQSELFKIFFKMVFGIVLLGLIHGLVFLPVFLAVFCKYNVPMTLVEEAEENEEVSLAKMNLDNNVGQIELLENATDTDQMI